MSFLSRITSLFALKQKTAVKLIALMSVIAFVANLAPELYRDVPSQASGISGDVTAAAPPTPPATPYIVITQDGNTDARTGEPSTYTGCVARAAGSAIPAPALNPQGGLCNFAQAIASVNNETSQSTGITTVIVSERLVNPEGTAFTSDHVIHLSSAHTIPAVVSGDNASAIVFDGTYDTNKKYVLQDASAGHNTLDYFFKIGDQSTPFRQAVRIKNFAFTALKKVGSAAITTDNPTTIATGSYPGFPTINPTRNVDGTRLRLIDVQGNYFGTTDGQTLLAQNELFQGIRLFASDLAEAPQISIANNDFYNTGLPIQLGTTESSTSNNCTIPVGTSGINITDNKIGLSTTNTIGTTPTGATLLEGGWNIYGINICELSQVDINNNTIVNSGGFFMDTGIYSQNSEVNIHENSIGVTTQADHIHLDHPNANQAIYGTGIMLIGNISISGVPHGSTINLNMVANIKLLDIPSIFTQFIYCPTLFQNRYDFTRSNGKNCGGTAIRLEGSSENTITNNFTAGIDGTTIYNNDGYGIELEGFSLPRSDTDLDLLSTKNKIIGNYLGLNKADGIMISSVDRYTTPPALDPVDRACKVSPTSGTYLNNCDNTILQNVIARNGAFNGSSFGLSTNNQGGIGIDLKQVTDSEQKYGDTFYSGSGTTNDTDISLNDHGDSDNGGNGMLNYPVINGTGALATSSTSYSIHGSLPDNANGYYWVEVYQVLCPANFLADPAPSITASNAHVLCDTNSRNALSQGSGSTFGQGGGFLCGTFVHKTADGSDWSCNPRDFGNDFTGGLVTATATEANAPKELTNYNSLIYSPFASGIHYSCDLAVFYYSNIPTDLCTSSNGNTSPADLIDKAGAITTNLGNTSEFSANVYLPAPSLELTKTVRSCSDTNSTNCSGTFSSSVNRAPGQVVEFRMDILNNTQSTSEINLVDALPTSMHWVAASCSYFNNLADIATTRPTTGAVTCTPSGQTLNISLPESGGILSSRHLTVFILAQVNSDTLNITVTNTSVITTTKELCNARTPIPCDARATVVVARDPVVHLIKTIQTPDTNSNLKTETLSAPTTATTINYQIQVDITGVTKTNVSSLIISDNFPKTISASQSMDYSTNGCQYTMKINHGTATAAHACDALSSINTTNMADLGIWHGSALATTFPAFTSNDTFTITITYRGIVPAIPLLSGESAATIINTAKFVGTDFPTQSDITTLTINPPSAQVNPVPPTIHKQVRACTGTTADTCTGAFNETGITNVAPGSTVEFRFEATSSSGATFNFKDAAPAGISFATASNSCLAYSNIDQLGGSAARPTSGGSACTIDSSTGTQLVTSPNVTIAANKYAYVYALATVSSTAATGTITNTASLNGNGCSASVAGCFDPATVGVVATTTGQVTIDKQVTPSTVTSSPTTTTDVTYTIVISKPNTFAINNATWTDTFPTTPVALTNYTCTSIVVAPLGAQTIACPTTFPPAGGSLLPAGTTINQGVTSITLTYTARVPVNAVTTTAQTVTNITTIGGTRSTDSVAINSTDTAVLTVNPNAGTSGGNTTTPVVTLTKRADNGVTTTDRSLEKIYKPGDTVNYTLSLLNSGATAATGVTLQDVFHSMLQTLAINALPAGATQSLTSTAFNFGNITVPTGTTPTTVTYHGTIASKDTFDLDLFDLNSSSNPARDDDFYAPKDADIVDDSIGTSGNSHRRAEDILGAPDGRFVSLGPDGSMTINLGTKVIVNGTGDDFALKSINQSTDDTDQSTEDLKVSVSQDGTTFKTINPRSSDELRYDLNKAHMAWVRYIKLEDQSSTTKAKAPGTDIDAICLLNIGVQLPNRVNMTVGNQTAFATEYVTVDVTKVFDKKPSVDNCTETVTAADPTPAPVVQPAPYIPTPPPSLPKTGAEPLVLISVVSSLAWVFTRKK